VTDEGLALLVWGITGRKPDGAASLNLELRAGGEGTISESAAHGISRNPLPRWPDHSTSHPRKSWGLWAGALALVVALGFVLFRPGKPDLYEVRVQTLDPEGRPVGGATVRTSTGNEPHFLQDGWWEVQVPRVKVPRDGKISIWAEHKAWEGSQTDITLANDANVRAEIRLKQPQTWILGRVVNEDNTALAGVHISHEGGLPGGATSESDGSFALQLPLPPERRVGLRAELEGWSSETIYCYTGRHGCQVVLVKP